MAVEVYQHWDGPELQSADGADSAKLHYRVSGTEDDLEAFAAAIADVPEFYNELPRRSVKIDRIAVDGWSVEADYSNSGGAEEDGEEVSFDTSGGTAKITQSLQTIARHSLSPEVAEDFKGAIGVTADGVDGCDIVISNFKFCVTATRSADFVTQAYIEILKATTGKVADAPFYGQAAGECLFVGAKGVRRSRQSPWKLSFEFAGQENQTGITVGPITGIDKQGWDYLWVRYVEDQDAAARRMIRRPRTVLIERVYRRANFANLGIGTSY